MENTEELKEGDVVGQVIDDYGNVISFKYREYTNGLAYIWPDNIIISNCSERKFPKGS